MHFSAEVEFGHGAEWGSCRMLRPEQGGNGNFLLKYLMFSWLPQLIGDLTKVVSSELPVNYPQQATEPSRAHDVSI